MSCLVSVFSIVHSILTTLPVSVLDVQGISILIISLIYNKNKTVHVVYEPSTIVYIQLTKVVATILFYFIPVLIVTVTWWSIYTRVSVVAMTLSTNIASTQYHYDR